MTLYKFIFVFLLSFTLLFNTEVYSQTKQDTAFHYKNTSVGSDINIFYKTGLKLYSAPAHFSGKDWLITGSVLAATGLAFFADEDVREFWQRNQSNSASDLLQIGAIYGNAGFAAALAGSVYIGGKLFKDPETAATGRMLIEGVFYAGLTNTIVKVVTGRSRPYEEQGPYFFKAFQFSEPHISFPSGHATMAFTLSTILSERINNIFATVGLYALASTTFVERMYSDKHWLSDCILGAATGFFTGYAVVKSDKDCYERKFSVLPFYEQKVFGLSVFYPM